MSVIISPLFIFVYFYVPLYRPRKRNNTVWVE